VEVWDEGVGQRRVEWIQMTKDGRGTRLQCMDKAFARKHGSEMKRDDYYQAERETVSCTNPNRPVLLPVPRTHHRPTGSSWQPQSVDIFPPVAFCKY
jgi:hypothetical protein